MEATKQPPATTTKPDGTSKRECRSEFDSPSGISDDGSAEERRTDDRAHRDRVRPVENVESLRVETHAVTLWLSGVRCVGHAVASADADHAHPFARPGSPLGAEALRPGGECAFESKYGRGVPAVVKGCKAFVKNL